MKKLFLMVFICMIMVSFCGCSKVIELTDEESYAIAEYAASLLIKYDRHLDSKYDEALEESAEDTIYHQKRILILQSLLKRLKLMRKRITLMILTVH